MRNASAFLRGKKNLICTVEYFSLDLLFFVLSRSLGSPFGSAKLGESKILVEAEKDNFIWATAGSTRTMGRAKNIRQLTTILLRYII